MILYFADRKMNILATASTGLPKGLRVTDDVRIQEVETGVTVFECTIPFTDEGRKWVAEVTAVGNYLFRGNDEDNEFYTIIEQEVSTEQNTAYIYCEDAGMDLLNEVALEWPQEGTTPASDRGEHPLQWYFDKLLSSGSYMPGSTGGGDTGFELGINEAGNDKPVPMSWGEGTVSETLLQVAKAFGCEIAFRFTIERMTVTHKYVDVYKKRGKDDGIQLRLGKEINSITTKSSLANLATALKCTGAEKSDGVPLNLNGYSYDDGEYYVDSAASLVISRTAHDIWSRYIWADEPETKKSGRGDIVKTFTYDTLEQAELVKKAIEELKTAKDPDVNYEVDFSFLPENVRIGDTVYIVDDAGALYLSSRILKLEVSISDNKRTALLGDFLVKDDGISQKVADLASRFAELAGKRVFYTWVAYADDMHGNGISLSPEGKAYLGTAVNKLAETPDISDPSIYKWVAVLGEQGPEGVGVSSVVEEYYLSDSSTELAGGSWTAEMPGWSGGRYIWKRQKVEWSDGTVDYTDPILASAINSAASMADDASNRVEVLNVATAEMDASLKKTQEDYGLFKVVVTDDITAAVGRIDKLSGEFASYKTIVADEITAAKGWMTEGAIGSAQIKSVSANKIRSGTIDTSLITIAAPDGRFQITGNTIQISDADRVRVQVGKDASGDYTLAVWDASGKLIWDALGATTDTIQRPIIRDDMVSEDAGIQGYKLDINSVIRAVNGATEAISSTVVRVGDKTLEVLLEEQENIIEGQKETLAAHFSQINANQQNIALKVDSQTYTADRVAMVSRLDTATSEISQMKDKISLAVTKVDMEAALDDIEIGGRNLIAGTSQDETALGGYPGAGYSEGIRGRTITNPSGDEYVLSFDAKSTVNGDQIACYFFDPNTTKHTASSAGQIGTSPDGYIELPVTNSWKRYWVKYTQDGAATTSGKSYIIGRRFAGHGAGSISIRAIKLEAGNKPTDWTSAAEDVDSAIKAVDSRVSAAESQIAVQANEIALRVKEEDLTGNYLIGKINLSSTTASIEAKHINLTGVVTISSLAADTKNKLDLVDGMTRGNLYATGYDTFENIPSVDGRIFYEKSSVAQVSIDTSTAYYGSRCLKIVAGDTDSYVYLGDKSNGYGCIPVVAGRTYIVSAYMKSSGTTNVELWVVGKDRKDNGNDQHVNGGSVTVGTSWTRVVTKYTASASYPFISLRIDNNTNGTSLWVDAIQIEKASSTSQGPSEFSPAGTTVIDGGRIAAGSVKAVQIDVANLFSQNITATNLTVTKNSKLKDITAENLKVMGIYGDYRSELLTDSSGLYLAHYNVDTGKDPLSPTATIALHANYGIGIKAYNGIELASRFGITIDGSGPYSPCVGIIGETEISGNTNIKGELSVSQTISTPTLSLTSFGNSKFDEVQMRKAGTSGADLNLVTYKNGSAVQFFPLIDSNNQFLPKAINLDGTYRQTIGTNVDSNKGISHMASYSGGKLNISAYWGATSRSTRHVVTSSSDIRLKCNISPTETNALDVINQIQMRQFTWKNTGEHQQLGFIADELEQIDKSFATGGGYDEDGCMNVKAVDTFYLLGYATKGLQELCQVTAVLDTRITAGEAQLTEHQKMLEAAYAEIAKLKNQLKQASA